MAEPSDEQAAMQHYLVCGTEDCQKNGHFYCNDCHRPLCEQCRDEHLSPDSQIHEIVIYRHRRPQLPVEKCNLHPTRNIDIYCKECTIPLCSECSTRKEHYGHNFDDLLEIYAEKYTLQKSEFAKIQRYFLPTTQRLKTGIKWDITEIKNIMESIRTSMKVEAESLKNIVDEVTSANMEHTYSVEKSLLEMLESQETTYDDYIAYLKRMTDEIQKRLYLTTQKLLFSETLKIKTIPETNKPVPPVFSRGKFNKNDVNKLLGRVYVPATKQERREIKPTAEIFTPLTFTETQLRQSKEKPDMKQTSALSSSLSKVREYSVPGVFNAWHISVDKLDRLWVSDAYGNLFQTDLQGNLLQKIQTSSSKEGNHTVTQDGTLIYTDREKKVIYKILPNKIITEFIKTRDWKPLSVHSSRINEDILVSMIKDRKAKVTRYSMTGKEIQNIQRNNPGQDLYIRPQYITENTNGDICTSDISNLVVVNKFGQRMFSYTGQGSVFSPCGICTDTYGHIIVCDGYSNTVHLLDQYGRFLSAILSSQQGINYPRGMCMDDENILYVGQCMTSTVTVYKYLK